MTLDARTSGMRDRAHQLRVGDVVRVDSGVDGVGEIPRSAIVAVRNWHTAHAGVQVRIRLGDGPDTDSDWINAERLPVVRDASSILADRHRTATKTCAKCAAVLPLSAFYRNPKMRDGTFRECGDCWRAHIRSHRAARRAAAAEASA